MEPPAFLNNSDISMVLDASAVINLNASKYANEIISALPNRLVVVQTVEEELLRGNSNGRKDAQLLRTLVESNLVEIQPLSTNEIPIYEDLVLGPTAETLDDGESATIAYAHCNRAIAIIDERKGNRICRARYPLLKTECTLCIFSHPGVQKTLGKLAIGAAISNALQNARMRVPSHYLDWVIAQIGLENAAQYSCLPRSVRLAEIKKKQLIPNGLNPVH